MMRATIFGAGRVGVSMAAWWRSLGHDVALADRAATLDAATAARMMARADLVAIALPDGALGGFAGRWKDALQGAEAIHFSGAMTIEGATAYHPLYSFPREPAPAAELGRALIARPSGARPFAALVPGATNPEIEIAPQSRALYHALAVVSGNFAAHLMNETAAAFSAQFGIEPGAALGPYFDSVAARFRENPAASMTGPLARRDAASAAANLEALGAEPRLLALYRAFLASAWPAYPGRGPD